MFKLKIDTKNDAFVDGDLVPEVVRILQVAIQKLESGEDREARLFDINGNPVGEYTLTKR
jgi:hypothetical protein